MAGKGNPSPPWNVLSNETYWEDCPMRYLWFFWYLLASLPTVTFQYLLDGVLPAQRPYLSFRVVPSPSSVRRVRGLWTTFSATARVHCQTDSQPGTPSKPGRAEV
ncbi:hypothetical protein LZ30DRAFT_690535 [Colletotrichum cereale]|nr:hypothetical protein LZ30DRAFT_690535 [Colletotrichum cereale]